MRRLTLLSALIAPLFMIAACGGSDTPAETSAEAAYTPTPITHINEDFSPEDDPVADLAEAMELAQAEGKYILMDVGGEWCSWCHLIDAYIETNQPTHEAFACAFVVLKVNYSDENENEEFLSAYPERQGYPHFFVLDAQGELVASQGTGELEEGRGYNEEAMVSFANQYCESA